MPKRLANGLTLLSAVVCVGSAMLVGRSFFRSDFVRVPVGNENECGAGTSPGQLVIWHDPVPSYLRYDSADPATTRKDLDEIWPELTGIRWIGGWGRYDFGAGIEDVVILPLWLLPLLTAIAPVRWYRARRREGGRGFAVKGGARE
jgi:hypothetical protein